MNVYMRKTIRSFIPSEISLLPIENIYRKIKYLLVNDEYEKAIHPTIPKEIVKEYNKVRRAGAHRFICKAPFNTLNFDSFGNVQVCNYNRTFMAGNLLNNSLEEIWNGESIHILRNALMNYDFSKGCSSCQNQLLEKDFEHFLASSSDSTGIEKDYPTRLSFELANICNLECIMCSGRFSNLIRKNREQLPAIKMAYDNKFFEQLKPFLRKVAFTDFFGGEPTMIKINYDIWNYIVAHNKKCHIQVTTNATELPKKFLALLNSGQFNIAVSIDGFTKSTYESIRINANFEQTMDNIHKLEELHKKKIINLQFSICPMKSNYQELPLGVELGNKMDIKLHFTHVIDPKELSIKYLHKDEILEIHRFLSSYKIEFNQSYAAQYNKKIYESLLNRIFSWSQEAENRIRFVSNLLLKDANFLQNEVKSFFIENKGVNKEKFEELYTAFLNSLQKYSTEDQQLITVLYLYEIKNDKELNMDFPNITHAKEIIDLYLKNISGILEQTRQQLMLFCR